MKGEKVISDFGIPIFLAADQFKKLLKSKMEKELQTKNQNTTLEIINHFFPLKGKMKILFLEDSFFLSNGSINNVT